MAVVSLVIVALILLYIVRETHMRLWEKELELALSFSADTAFEGEQIILTQTLSNKKLLPLPWLAIKFQVSRHLLFENHKASSVSDDYYKTDLFSVPGYRRVTRRLPFVCAKRGFYKIKSAELLSYNLLMTQKAVQPVAAAAFLTVYPRLITAEEPPFPAKKLQGEVIARRFINPDPFEFRGVREYSPTDALKTINHAATAKCGELMVNTYEFTVSKEITVYLNFEPYCAWPDNSLFEQTISYAATLAAGYIAKGIPVRLVSGSCDIINGQSIDTGTGASQAHLYEIFAALARLDLPRNEPPAPIVDFLPRPVYCENENKAHILISTYAGPELMERYAELNAAYSNITWVWPYTARMADTPPDAVNVSTWRAAL